MEDSRNRFDQFEPLVHEHHVRVRAFVRSLGVESDSVDDLAQDAFMEAFRKWDTFDHRRDFGKWVRGIAANLVRNELRKRGRRQRLLHRELTEVMLEFQTKEDDLSPPVMIETVRGCLAKLSPEHRALVTGHYEEGLTAIELGDRFQKSPANIRQMLVRIRRQIRVCIDQQHSSKSHP